MPLVYKDSHDVITKIKGVREHFRKECRNWCRIKEFKGHLRQPISSHYGLSTDNAHNYKSITFIGRPMDLIV